MGDDRSVNYQWVEEGLFELSERYGEQALRFIQDADPEKQYILTVEIIGIINEHIDRVEKLIEGAVSRKVKDSLDFERPDRTKINEVFLKAIVPISDSFRKRVLEVERNKTITKRMDHSPLMLGGVLRCIVDLRERVEALMQEPVEESVEEVSFKEITEEELESFPFIEYIRQKISPRLLKDIVQSLVKGAGLKGVNELKDKLNLQTNIYSLFSRKTVPSEGEKRVDYIKVWNWMIETTFNQASTKEGLSIRTENAIQRAR